MKCVIAGTRSVHDYNLLVQTVQRSGYDITEVVCGMATGIDTLGEQWARSKDIPIKAMPADWNRYGKKAGPMRNRQMAEYCDCAVIIWDGESPGTRNMINEMIRVKKPYYIGMTYSTIEDFV